MRTLTRFRLLFAVTLMSVLLASPASAHHVVWLDFSLWNLGAFPTVNGHTPATQADRDAVRELIIANMVKDYSTFDIYFTTVQPPRGRHTWVIFFPGTNAGYFGCAGGSCCALGNCTGRGSWDEGTRAVEIYTGQFATYNAFSGANATAARIANGIADTASHELGHVLDLSHCHSADDFVGAGVACTDGYGATADTNVNWHIMASGASTGLTTTQRATRSRFFSVHSERRVLYLNLQPRNHWAHVADADGDGDGADLVYGRLESPSTVPWTAHLSNGASLGDASAWSADAGERADLFYTADVSGDSRADLVYARIVDAATVRWYVRESAGNGFGNVATWALDAGDPGDIFRLGDVNGDGRVDLIYGRPIDATTVKWYVRQSHGAAFDAAGVWSDDAGAEGAVFLIGDVTGEGNADLIVGSRGNDSWHPRVYHSNGSTAFSLLAQSHEDGFTGAPDYLLLGDVDADGRADLMFGRVMSDTDVDWFVAKSTGCTLRALNNTRPPMQTENCFGAASKWSDGTGDAGDLFRLADIDGDARSDLIFGRPRGMTSLASAPDLTWIRWHGRRSTGTGFEAITTLAADASDEGDIVP
jgi:hypothetical protein